MSAQQQPDALRLSLEYHKREIFANSEVRKAQKFHRRQLVALYWLTGQYNHTELAQKLNEEGVAASEDSVRRDVAALKSQWKRQSLQDIGSVIEQEVAKLDTLEEVLLNDFKNKRFGADAYADRMLKIAERRARLLGADQPAKLHVLTDHRDVSQLTNEELDAIIRGELPKSIMAAAGLPPFIDSSEIKPNGHTNGHAVEVPSE